MALVTVQRSPSPSNTPESVGSDHGHDAVDLSPLTLHGSDSSLRSPNRNRSFSESYFAVKGAALILSQSECPRVVKGQGQRGADIQHHLQSMFVLLRPQDTIRVAVKLESVYSGRIRYICVVSTSGRQDTEESIILGLDVFDDKATIGLVLPIWGDTDISLDGDGGFSVTSNKKHHIFKPVSVQAMWSALQSLIKVRDTARLNNYYPKGLTHTWVTVYEFNTKSEQSCINEWNTLEDIESHRKEISSELTTDAKEKAEVEKLLKARLKEIMMTVDLEEVTCKYLRNRLEEDLKMSLKEYRHFIDEEMIVIMRQMDSPSMIFDHLYLGSEWNASNLDELKDNDIGYILNITREIDNFYPGMFEYMNIRLYDREESELLKHWDNTYKFICKARQNHSKVLVHCKMGISRSASTVIAFAMKDKGWSLDQAYQHVKSQRSCIKPNSGFMQQLVTYQGILDASKQRHNTLWRSKSAGNLNESSNRLIRMEQEECFSDEVMQALASPAVETSRPRSWSPDDSTTKLLLKTQDLASSDEDSSENDMNTAEVASAPEFRSLDDDDVFHMRCFDWTTTTDDIHFASSPSIDSFDMFPGDASPELPYTLDQPNVVLLSHCELSNDEVSDNNCVPQKQDIYDSDIEDFVAEDNSGKHYHGFYDYSMFLFNYQTCDNGEEVNDSSDYYYHPDITIEILQAQQRKHRRIAQLLKLSQVREEEDNAKKTPIVHVENSETKDQLVPPNTPSFTKLKPDDYWIKDFPISPQAVSEVPIDDDASAHVSEVDIQIDMDKATVNSESNIDQELLTDKTTPPKEALSDDTVPSQERIVWKPGSVKRQTLSLEGRLLSESNSRRISNSSSSCGSCDQCPDVFTEELLSSSGSHHSSPIKNSFKAKHSLISTSSTESFSHELTQIEAGSNNREASKERTRSVYDSEEIELEPGLVRRTKEEYENRNKQVDSAFETAEAEIQPVQRSASLKDQKASHKARDSERRHTCQPIMQVTPSSEQQGSQSERLTLEREVEESTSLGALRRFHIGDDTIEMEEGLVQKQLQDFEKFNESPSAPLLDVPQMKERSQSPFITEDIDFLSGSVKRQTKEIEEKFSKGDSSDVTPKILGLGSDYQDEYEKEQVQTYAEIKSDVPVDQFQMDQAEGIPAYKEEDITWSVGTVQQHKIAIEEREKEQDEIRHYRKTCGDELYKMTPKTLHLIREIGQCLMESPVNIKQKTRNLVRQVTHDVELRDSYVEVEERLQSLSKAELIKEAHTPPCFNIDSLPVCYNEDQSASIASQPLMEKTEMISEEPASEPCSSLINPTEEVVTNVKTLVGQFEFLDECDRQSSRSKLDYPSWSGDCSPAFSRKGSGRSFCSEGAVDLEDVRSRSDSWARPSLPTSLDIRNSTSSGLPVRSPKGCSAQSPVLTRSPSWSKISKTVHPRHYQTGFSTPSTSSPASSGSSSPTVCSPITSPHRSILTRSNSDVARRPLSAGNSRHGLFGHPRTLSESSSRSKIEKNSNTSPTTLMTNPSKRREQSNVVRGKRLQGKSHPLSHLEPEKSPSSGGNDHSFYNTM